MGASESFAVKVVDLVAKARRADAVLTWLRTEPPIDALIERFPEEWATLRREAAKQGTSGDDALRSWILGGLRPVQQSRGHARAQDELVAQEVRRRMLLELLRQANLSRETGQTSGTIRFNKLNGSLLQRVFFEDGLRRKPASMLAYRTVWPLAWQRRFLLPLVRRQGIYCFYSRAFVRRLARLVDGRRCVEIAAGDGTLSRFLRDEGVAVTATDDFSWQQHVDYDAEQVDRLDARTSLDRFAPEVVVCSWPPPGNSFEKRVFVTGSVDTYVVIVSRSDQDAGDWAAYRDQQGFSMKHDTTLSGLVLPRGSSRVFVFTREHP